MSKIKPKWPYRAETILTAAPNGQWMKKHRGRPFYFGVWADPEAALERWRREWPSITAGAGRPMPVGSTAVPLTHLCIKFMADRRAKVDAGDLTAKTLTDYKLVCDEMVRHFGKRDVCTFEPGDFAGLAKRWAHISPRSRRKRMVIVRTIFRWAGPDDQKLIPAAHFGSAFASPKTRTIRLHDAKQDERLVTRDEFHALQRVAGPRYRAMMWLAINGGYGNTDIATLETRVIDLAGGWIDCVRHKTGAERRLPLWPETIEALRAIELGETLAFTALNGMPLIRKGCDEIGRAFRYMSEAVDFGGTFYWFRYTFSTVATETGDYHARDIIMGHTIRGVPEGYVQRFPESRLVLVSNHVRSWLLGDQIGQP